MFARIISARDVGRKLKTASLLEAIPHRKRVFSRLSRAEYSLHESDTHSRQNGRITSDSWRVFLLRCGEYLALARHTGHDPLLLDQLTDSSLLVLALVSVDGLAYIRMSSSQHVRIYAQAQCSQYWRVPAALGIRVRPCVEQDKLPRRDHIGESHSLWGVGIHRIGQETWL